MKVSNYMAGRISTLDSLRGLAIGLVIVGHYFPFNLVHGTAALILSPFVLGGVILFFMLSGFLIDKNLTRNRDFIKYGMRRILRILPAYYVALAAIFLFEGFVTHERVYTLREVALNAALLSDVIPAMLMSGVFWTLLIEIKFYAVAPIVKSLGERATFAVPLSQWRLTRSSTFAAARRVIS
jgi:peptidoglycan/LPS O-acetylase OafA/YrhL